MVKIVVPPAGSAPGERLFLEGGAPMEETPKTLSSKIWGAIVPHLDVRGGAAGRQFPGVAAAARACERGCLCGRGGAPGGGEGGAVALAGH